IGSVYEQVRVIVEGVRSKGDRFILETSMDLKPGTASSELEVTREEIRQALNIVPRPVLDCLKAAAQNIAKFHRAQKPPEMTSMEVSPGILAGRLTRPLESVGCYIPGGRAAYPSTLLMTVIPAREAGVDRITVVTPPGPDMTVNPLVLAAAHIAGCHRVFKVGGPWAVAALAFGTATIPRVDKIVGPGNKYVTAAKMLVYGRVDIDSPAGPSESLILADHTARAGLAAFDFLSQAEHDPDSAAILVTTSQELAVEVCDIISAEFDTLPRKEILAESLSRHSRILLAGDMEEAVSFANAYAPEHLQICTEEPFATLGRIRHAGSIFLGPYSPVAAGDYASGTNHVLPTGRCARMFSGLSVDDFIKKPTFQLLSRAGLASISGTISTLAEEEGLPLHARSVRSRFE
ncbi:MAG TPA: histidinol dehydrogenase, partial [Desulfobacteraceae bacterium]|nr:histidinol dehydrogenase [Desulfobacteraceae bacterium]